MTSHAADDTTVAPTPGTCCSIIPMYILSNISQSPDAPTGARDRARSALIQSRDLIQARQDSNTQQHVPQTRGNPGPHRNQGIVPDFILNSIASTYPADSKGEESALHALNLSAVIRDRRESKAASLRPANVPNLHRLIYVPDKTGHGHSDEVLVRSEGEPATGDSAVDECYDSLGAVFNFFNDVLGRNSIDGAGMDLIGSVHYGTNSSVGCWDGERMILGDGDGVYCNRYTASVDVIGHELTHGVVQHTAKFESYGEPGALNESIADVFGSMVKQYELGQNSAEADWLIGVGVFTAKVNATAMRSMKAPGTAYDDGVIGKDTQLAHYADVLKAALPMSNDNGGVHVYSGVPSRAFYLVATRLGGHSWERAGKIWWAALLDCRLLPTSNFHAFARLTSENAERLYDQSVKAVVDNAWRDVGVDTGAKDDR